MNQVESYVGELGGMLRGPRRHKHDLLREVEDHLTDAAEGLERRGLTRHDAERQATRAFGVVEQIAPEYQAVLSSGHERRTGLLLFAVTVVQPPAWNVLATAPSPQASPVAHALNQTVEVAGLIAIASALAVTVLSGFGVRLLGIRYGLLRASGLVTLTVGGAMTLLAGAIFATSSDPGWWGLAVVGVVAVAPFALVAAESARCLRSLGPYPPRRRLPRRLPGPEVRA